MLEVNYKIKFSEKYFNIKLCDFDVLNRVDLLLKDVKGNVIFYVENKDIIYNKT